MWIKISVYIDPVAREAVSAKLFELGCDGVVTESFHDTAVTAYLPSDRDMEEIRKALQLLARRLVTIFSGMESPEIRLEFVGNQDWGLYWRRHFKPEIITPRLLVLPAWEDPPEQCSKTMIRMDPGPAFGTGRHATTKMCLIAMEAADMPARWSMLDVGTGSGILAVYGALLGAEKVVAIDNDLEAVRWAGRNIFLNGLSADIEVSHASVEGIRASCLMITANLILNVILEIFADLYRLLEPGGRLIVSGLLRHQSGEVEELMESYGLRDRCVMSRDEWACISAGKAKAQRF